ncbi:cryptochrome/photolyase family protein [Enterococcus sp. LJL98]
MTSVMWFRKDLRVKDNKAFYHACRDSKELILLFQVNPKQLIEESPNHQAFFSSVAHFKEKLDEACHLQILFGDPKTCFQRLIERVPSIDKLYFNCDETGYGRVRDTEISHFLEQKGLRIYSFHDAYLHHAQEIKKETNDFYQVFTPYYKKWCNHVKEAPLNSSLAKDIVVAQPLFLEDEAIFKEQCQSLPTMERQKIGEEAAMLRLTNFIESDLMVYDQVRDFPILDQTSHLSRFLRTGELSIRTVWEKIQQAVDSDGKRVFEKELCWRDFYHMIAYAHPDQKEKAIQKQFRGIEWENDPEKFLKWQQGQTGYPIVDAGMRQLKETGWMHNRLRMITASFLTKDLFIDWRWGEKYFQKMLIDYDPASNIGGWQWAASTGMDAAPYFRIFNPTVQSQKFDASGAFIKKYVKELSSVPKKWIHQPEKMPVEEQEKIQFQLGTDYPYPIVNHQERRKMALARYEFSKEYMAENQ